MVSRDYPFVTIPEANMEGTFKTHTGTLYVLFDMGLQLSFVSPQLVKRLGIQMVPIVLSYFITTTLGGLARLVKEFW